MAAFLVLNTSTIVVTKTKIMKLLLLTIASAFALNTYSQAPTIQWQKAFIGSNFSASSSIKQTSDGSYITVGNTQSSDGDFAGNHGSYDGWIAKLDINGNTQWKKIIGGSQQDGLNSVIPTNDGGYIAAGFSCSNDGDVSGHHGSTSNNDCWVVKFDNIGNIQWQKSFGGTAPDEAISIEQTGDGGYIINATAGSINGDVTSNHGIVDIWVIKTDSNGNIQWQKTYGGSRFDHSRFMSKTNDGGYIIAARSFSNNGDVTQHIDSTNVQNGWVLKLSSSGNIDWEKSFLESDYTWLQSIKQTSDNGFIIAGHSSASDSMTSSDGLIIKLDANGILQWKKNYGGSYAEKLIGVIETNNGEYLIAGNTSSNDGDVTNFIGHLDCWLLNISSNGNLNWQKTYGGTAYDDVYDIQETNDGSYILSGNSASDDVDVTINPNNPFLPNAWIVKFTPLSTSIQENQITSNSFSIYPNPANDIIHINESNSLTNESYSIVNTLGQTVLSGKLENQHSTINIKTIEAGIYFLQLGNKQTQSYKIIKN